MIPPDDYRSRPLTERLLLCFPSGHYCLPALLRLLELRESRDVPTACVDCTARPRLLINPDFAERHAETPEKLMMLVLHELHHVILGHTRLYQRATPLDNLVFDAVINAMLCHMFPGDDYTSLLTGCYRDDRFPECFLRPADNWRCDFAGGVWALPDPPPVPRALRQGDLRRLAPLHQALYGRGGATYGELREAFSQAVDESEAGRLMDRLLGDHREEDGGASSAGRLEHRAPVLLEEIRRIVERWPRPAVPMIGRSLHEMLEEARIPLPPPSNRRALAAIIRWTGGETGGARRRDRGQDSVAVSSVIPRAERRAVVIRALGGRTLLHSDALPAPARIPARGRVHVYLDVSGSIGDLVGPLYRALLECRHLVHPAVHLFSTQVADVGFEELRRGVCPTTGGTDIGCVAEHMRAGGVRRAVLVTDGYVGQAGETARQTLETARVGVALTPGEATHRDLEPYAGRCVQLRTEDLCIPVRA